MNIKSSSLFAVGDEVRILPGASAWMRVHNYWIDDWPESIDGLVGTILRDYTQYGGNDCHYEVVIEGVTGYGVHPRWLAANAGDEARAARRVEPLVGVDFPCIKSVLDELLKEAQERFPIGSEITREEIIAWLDSRYIHWHPNSVLSVKPHPAATRVEPVVRCRDCGRADPQEIRRDGLCGACYQERLPA